MSRANPVRRDTKVSPPTVKMRPSIEASSRGAWRESDRSYGIQLIRSYCRGRRATAVTVSPAQRAAHGGDDVVLGRLVEIGVHGQAGGLVGNPFASRPA